MKKIIIAVIMVVAMMSCAFAQDYSYTEVMEKLNNFMEENNITDKFDGTVDEYGIFGYAGALYMNGLTEEYGIKESWDNRDEWFRNWYESKLEEVYPEYGNVAVVITKIGKVDDLDVYHITIAAENDLVDWIEGDQYIVDIMAVFY